MTADFVSCASDAPTVRDGVTVQVLNSEKVNELAAKRARVFSKISNGYPGVQEFRRNLKRTTHALMAAELAEARGE